MIEQKRFGKLHKTNGVQECGTFQLEIPCAVENLNLPSPELLTYYKNYEARILWLDSDVTIDTLELARNILLWNMEDAAVEPEMRKPIRLMIHSSGGDLEVNNSLISIITLSKTPVWSINTGVAASAAAYISMACHRRYALPGSTYLLHAGSAENVSGTFSQVISFVEDYQAKVDNLFEYILRHSNITREMLEHNFVGEWYMDADEAVKYGVADEIVTDIDMIL